jgi:hypothetical protein
MVRRFDEVITEKVNKAELANVETKIREKYQTKLFVDNLSSDLKFEMDDI